MVTDKIYILPLLVFILLPATYCITYVIAVALNHVEPGLPYISDTGTYSPESCIFGQLVNLGALLIFLTMYVRYKQVHTYYRYHMSGETIPRLNKISLFLGAVASFGMSLVANFQETNLLTVHLIGALLCFGPGTVYVWLQTWLSYLVCPIINKRYMGHLRFGLACVCTVALLTCFVAGPMSLLQFHGTDKTKWYPEDGGFEWHIVSTIGEWILAIAFDFFVLTYVREFQRITMATPQVYLAIEELRAQIPDGSPTMGGDEGDDTSVDDANNPQGRPFRELLA